MQVINYSYENIIVDYRNDINTGQRRTLENYENASGGHHSNRWNTWVNWHFKKNSFEDIGATLK